MSTNRPPLSGVKVLDLTRLLPGPACTLHLADMGADVIKIEDTGAGDYASNSMRAVLHRNKRALRIDLKQADGVAVLKALAREADVLVESFRPGVMDRLGVGYAVLVKDNPRLVFCSITGWGQDGPMAQKAGHDINYCSIAGAASQIGTRDGELALSNLQIADLMGGAVTGAMGILAALFDARRTGTGRHVDIAMADSVLAHLIIPLATRAREGKVRTAGQDTLTGAYPCYGFYRTADGRQLAVGALEGKFWDRFCELLGRDDLKTQSRPESPEAAARVRMEVSAVLASRPMAHWEALFAHEDCCVTPVLDFEEALHHEQFTTRGMVRQSQHPHYGAVTHLACPIKMTSYTFGIERHAPLPGEHSGEILREAGFDDGRIAALLHNGAVA